MKKNFISFCLILCFCFILIFNVKAEKISDIMEIETTTKTTTVVNSNYDSVPYDFIELDPNYLFIIEGVFLVILIVTILRKKFEVTIPILLTFMYIIFMFWLLLSGKYENLISLKNMVVSTCVFSIVVIVIYIVLKKVLFKLDSDKIKKKRVLTQYQINQIDSSIDADEIVHDAFNLYVNTQKCYVDFNYDALQKNLSREFYEFYKSKLDKLRNENLRKEITDFQYVDGGVIAIRKLKEEEEFVVKLVIDMNIKTFNNNVLIDENKYSNVSVLIKFKKDLFVKMERCFNCGKDLYFEKVLRCPNCNQDLVLKKYTVLDIKL